MKRLSLLFCLLALASSAFAQRDHYQGLVNDNNGEPLSEGKVNYLLVSQVKSCYLNPIFC